MKLLNGFVKYFLPSYGPFIENLILYGSLTINDNTVCHPTEERRTELKSIFFRHEKSLILARI